MDGDAFYDEEFYYDAPDGTGKGTMARIALNLSSATPTTLATRTGESLVAIAADPTVYTGATEVLANGNAAVLALEAKNTLVGNLITQLAEARADRDVQAGLVVEFYTNQLAPYVSDIAQGQAGIILAAKMSVARTPVTAPPIGQVLKVSIKPGGNVGTAAVVWEAVFNRRSYEVQVTSTPEVEASWAVYDILSSVDLQLTGQPSGQRRFVRVRAIGPYKTKGIWSDYVGCMIA